MALLIIHKADYADHGVTEFIVKPNGVAPHAALVRDDTIPGEGHYEVVSGSLTGWHSPTYADPNDAIRAWNGLMGAAKVRTMLPSTGKFPNARVEDMIHGPINLHRDYPDATLVRHPTLHNQWIVTQSSDDGLKWIGPTAATPRLAQRKWDIVINRFHVDHEAEMGDPWPKPRPDNAGGGEIVDDVLDPVVAVQPGENGSDPDYAQLGEDDDIGTTTVSEDAEGDTDDWETAVDLGYTPEVENAGEGHISGERRGEIPPEMKQFDRAAWPSIPKSNDPSTGVFQPTKAYAVDTQRHEIPTGLFRPRPLLAYYPFDELEVGDSFAVGTAEGEVATMRRALKTYRNSRGKAQGKHFRTKTVDENTVRCWRVK